eukprot:NODE_2349_length_592_cov_34.425806_g2299_i0.p1 GENE.NODE_2349_length_592_cov_34.425806_g2299_i0~~NODE_2349_length_592_cov_34.425806_g2299_i0.p1  ORF type:complete len:130 (+),score=18.33 NODE_2349_length_592_cov_34.425806_g2299_i0:66-455(+)
MDSFDSNLLGIKAQHDGHLPAPRTLPAEPELPPIATLKELEKRKTAQMRACYGSWMPSSYEADKAILANVRRIGGLPSRHIGMDILTGNDERVEFEDYLQRPEFCEKLAPAPHLVMEASPIQEMDFQNH